MLRRHMHSPIPVITEYRPDVPDDLGHLIYCLLAKDPTDRLGSAADVEHLLTPFFDEERQTSAGKSGGTEARADTWAGPNPVQATGQELAELHQRAQELAEEERFVQAAEVLERALEPAQGIREALDPQVVAIRLDLANLRMLAGDYRMARDDFEGLARVLEQPGGDQSLGRQCREQARSCQMELGE